MPWQQLYFELLYRFSHPDWLTNEVQPELEEAVWEGSVRGPRVLDVGCGAGDNALFLAARGFQVTAIDISAAAIAMARAKARAAYLDVRFEVLDASRLAELGPQPFDTVLDFGLFHHLGSADQERYLQALRAVCHPRSRLLLQCYSAGGGRPWPLLPMRPRLLSQDQLREAFGKSWQIDWMRAASFASRRMPRVPAWLAALQPAGALARAQ